MFPGGSAANCAIGKEFSVASPSAPWHATFDSGESEYYEVVCYVDTSVYMQVRLENACVS
jgi:hypothetical protein